VLRLAPDRARELAAEFDLQRLPLDFYANPYPKKRAQEYVKLYEAAQGTGSVTAFGSYTWDACLELEHTIPASAKERAAWHEGVSPCAA